MVCHHLLRAEEQDALYEAGCGTGTLLEQMPTGFSYFGFDINAEYIETARRNHLGHEFEVATAEQLSEGPARPSDVFYCLGLLHHLDDDQVRSVLRLAVRNLKPSGRFVALEPCYLLHQSPFSRLMISMDRGTYVRKTAAYLDLVKEFFTEVRGDVVTGLNNLCYTHFAIEATSPRHP
jgi:2-polyprenyl-3-methyl-5-hydroxy-6-metoxy-1,4-benzoquinol methylase